ncbi:MAG: hypothetical protein WDN46_22925 [Methylocella sp.]
MIKILLLLAAMLAPASAFAQVVQDGAPNPVPTGIVGSNVGICDPGNPTNCIKPNADGSVTVEGPAFAFGDHSLNAALSTTPATGATLTTTQTNVATAVVSLAPINANNVQRIVKNCTVAPNATTIFIGNSSVTVLTGFALAPGESRDMSVFTGQIFGIGSDANGRACFMAN